MKRFSAIVAAFAILILLQPSAYAIEPILVSHKPVHIELVIDASGSMQKTNEKINMLDILKMTADLNSGEDVFMGYVAFADDVTGSMAPISLTDSNLEELQAALSSIVYKGNTDIGRGLNEAYTLLTNAAGGEVQRVILFISDGNIDIPDGSERSNEASERDVERVISSAKEMDIPIHCIGLGADNRNTDYLGRIASQTNGTCHLDVTSSNELLEALQDIIGKYTVSSFQAVEFDSNELTISPASNTSQTRLLLMSVRNLEREGIEATGFDAVVQTKFQYLYTVNRGNELQLLFERDPARYICYRLDYHPSKGVLDIVEGYQSSEIHFYFTLQDEPVYNEALYTNLSTSFAIYDNDGAFIEKIYPTPGADGLKASFPFAYGENYQIVVNAENERTRFIGNSMSPFSLSLSPTPRPVAAQSIAMWNSIDNKIPLSQFGLDEDDIIYFEILPLNSAELKIENGHLIITPSKTGAGRIQITAADEGGGEQLISFPINILPIWEYPPALVGLCILIVVLLMVGLITFKRSKRRSESVQAPPMVSRVYFTGSFDAYFVKVKSQNDILPIKWLLAEFSNRSKITLYDLLVISDIHEELPEAKRIFFMPGEQGTLHLCHDTNCTILVHHTPLPKNEVAELEYNDKFYIIFEDGITEIEIYYRKVKAKAN